VLTGAIPILRPVVVQSLRRAGEEIAAVARGDTSTHEHLRGRLVAVTIGALVLDAIGSVLMFLLERDVDRTDIHSFGDAVFFVTAQLLTVSSSMTNPLTTGGRILDVVLELYAITVVATVAGSLGAFFLRRGHEREMAVNATTGGTA
jgi:hypothetical protein